MFTKSSLLLCFSLTLILAAVGCAASQPATSGAAFPTGNFAAIDNMAGSFDLEIKADGNFTITLWGRMAGGHEGTGTQKTSGTYTISQNQVVFKGSFCDSGEVAYGTYTWNYDGKMLTFNSSSDKCMDRWRVLNYVWTKQ